MGFVSGPGASGRRSGFAGVALRGGAQAGGGLEQAVARARSRLAGRAAGLTAAWTGTALCGLLVAAWLAAGGAGWTAGSPGPLVLACAMGCVVVAAAWAWARLRRRWASERAVARVLDGAAGLSAGTTLGGLELARGAAPGTSAGLRDLALRSVGDRLSAAGPALSGAMDRQVRPHARRARIGLALAAAVLAAVAARAPGRALSAWGGILTPVAILVEPVLPAVGAGPGTVEAVRGSEVEVEVRAPLRDSARLRWESAGQVARSRTLPLVRGVARTRLPPLASVTRYWVETADGARSPEYVLTPVDPLLVADVEATVRHPPHTGLPPVERRGGLLDLEVVEGGRISLRGRGNRAVGKARLLAEGGRAEVDFDVRGVSFSAEWVPRSGGVFQWDLADESGAEAALAPPPLRVRVVADMPPQVAIEHPEPLAVLPPGMRQPLVATAQDDFGIARMEIVAWRVSAFGESGPPVVAGVATSGAPGVIARPVLDVSRWALSPGDTVRYLARVMDNRPFGQWAETPERVLRTPGTADLDRAAGEAMEDAARTVEELAAGAAQASEEARSALEGRDRADRSPGSEQAGFGDREEVARALERRDLLAGAVDSLRAELSALRETLEATGLASDAARERLGELARALDEIPELAGQERRPLSEMDADELAEALERAARDQEEMRRRLEESLDAFRHAAANQGLDVAAREAQDLAGRQESMAAAMAEGDANESAAQQQEALARETAGLEQEVQELMERLAGLGETPEGMQAAAGQLSQGAQQMRQAAQSARRQDGRAAGQQAAEAAGDLSRAAQALDEAGAEMREQRMAALRAALSRTAVDALSLARRQAEVQEQMRGGAASQLPELRGAEAAIAQGIRNLAESYAAETGMAAPGARDLLAAAGEALEHVDRTVEALEARRSSLSPLDAARQVVRALNETARLAMASAQEDPSASAASASAAMMQQLAELAQQQGDIIQDAAALAPGRQETEAAAEAMREMAGEQQDVAGDLGAMAEDEANGDEGPLGDLGDMAAEARQLAQALAQGRFDPEVLRRQERLFHRLLDAGRGLERDEQAQERESERPDDFVRQDVAPLSASSVDALRYGLPDPAAMRALPPAMRALVVRYFQRLNERPPPPGPAGAANEAPRR